jgi:ubiquinone/menaquinone biosynthesis C-methylase UbiE
MHERRFGGDIHRLRSPERLERLEVDRVTDLCLAGLQAKSVLDIGTGTGVFAEAFAKRGYIITGIDANQEMVEAARRFVPEGDFRLAEAESLPFSDGSFDLAFMGVLLHEADDPGKALSEAGRVARRRIAILEWPYREEAFPPPLAHRLSPARVAALAQSAGLPGPVIQEFTHTVLYWFEK